MIQLENRFITFFFPFFYENNKLSYVYQQDVLVPVVQVRERKVSYFANINWTQSPCNFESRNYRRLRAAYILKGVIFYSRLLSNTHQMSIVRQIKKLILGNYKNIRGIFRDTSTNPNR